MVVKAQKQDHLNKGIQRCDLKVGWDVNIQMSWGISKSESRAQTGGPEPRGGWSSGWRGEEEGSWGGVPEGLDISRIYDTQRSFESQEQNIKIDTGVTQEPLELFGRVGGGGGGCVWMM